MNRVVLVGRLTRDPEVRSTAGQNPMSVARYTVAVDRRVRRNESEQSADFVPCVAFGKAADFAGKYFRKGMRVAVEGRIQTGSYKNRDGNTIYTTDVIIDNQEFAESKNEGQAEPNRIAGHEDFMVIPDDVDDSGLPFN